MSNGNTPMLDLASIQDSRFGKDVQNGSRN